MIGGPDLTMREIDRAAKVIGEKANPDANIIYGTTIDPDMTDQVRITVIATGFDSDFSDSFGPKGSVFKKSTDLPEDEEEKKSSNGGKDWVDDLNDKDRQFDIPAFLRGR
jgi:cell division protein FtsZ